MKDASTIGVKLANAEVPEDTEYKFGELVVEVNGIEKVVELLLTFEMLPKVIVGNAFTAPETDFVSDVAPVDVKEIDPVVNEVLAAVIRT